MNNFMMRLAFLTPKQVGIFALVATGLFYYFMFEDVAGDNLLPQIESLRGELQKEQAKKADTERTLKERDRLQETLAKLTDRYEVLSRLIPTQINDSDLNKQMNQLIQEAKVRPQGRKPLGTKNLGVLDEISYNLKLAGGYNEFGRFVYLVSTLERVMVVKTIKMVPTDPYDGRVIGDVVVAAYKLAANNPAPTKGRK